MQHETRGFVEVALPTEASIDRELGYHGHSRLVMFYYEPRGEEVIWNDGGCYGFGCGGWVAYMDEIVPLARQHGVDVTDQTRQGEHVLLVDRELHQAYFADRRSALMAVEGQTALAQPREHKGED